jgi:hypothetical protein
MGRLAGPEGGGKAPSRSTDFDALLGQLVAQN